MTSVGLRISICIGSEVFARGLQGLLREQKSRPVEVSLDLPREVIRRLNSGALDLLILDRAYSESMAPHMNRACRRPRLLLVSEQLHAGSRRCELLDQACGFFPARSEETELRELMQIILDCPCLPPLQKSCQQCPLFSTREPRTLPLTDRESEIFALIGQLKGPSQIAAELGVSPKTVEAHCANIKEKLNLNDSKQLLKSAIDWVEGR
jgi:DNA-binding CsgD family transcriptional regulator